MSLNLNGVMDGIGQLLKGISGLRVFDFIPDSFSPPAAVVSLPEFVEYDYTFAKGSDHCQINVHVLVGKVSDRSARDQLSAYIGRGTGGVKQAIENDPTLGGSAMSVRVERVTVSVMTVAGMDYLAATFELDVVA